MENQNDQGEVFYLKCVFLPAGPNRDTVLGHMHAPQILLLMTMDTL